MRSKEILKVHIQYFNRGDIQRATIEHHDVDVFTLKRLLFGKQADRFISIKAPQDSSSNNTVTLVANQAERLSSLKEDKDTNEVTVTFVNADKEAATENPVINIREHDRLIAALKASNADVLVLMVGSKISNQQSATQDNPPYAQQLSELGHSTAVFNLDYGYQNELDLNTNNYGVNLDPSFLKTQQVLEVLKEQVSQGKKIILFDNSSIKFTDFTNWIGVNQERYGFRQHDNLEILVGRGASSKVLIPIVFCSEYLFSRAESTNPPSELLMHSYPFQPQGPTYKTRAQTFTKNLRCELFATPEEIPVSQLFIKDRNFSRYPEADILAALKRTTASSESIRKFITIFNRHIDDIQSIEGLHGLLEIFQNKYMAQHSSGVRDSLSMFFRGNTNLVSYIQEKMRSVLSRLPVNPSNEQKLLEISDAIEYRNEKIDSLRTKPNSP